MKKAISVLICVALLLLCSSCSERGTGKGIVYPLSKSPSTLDPQYTTENEATLVINNIFEGLVRTDENGEIIPGIAESWEISEDHLTYTFHLKEGTEWYCPISMKTAYGDEFYEKFCEETVKAADFVFACQRAVDPATQSPNANRLFVIKNAAEVHSGELELSALGVTAPDDNTVIFTLNEVCEQFLSRLTENEFMPCNEEFFNSMGGRYGLSPKHILCNGPFYLSAWDTESSMTIRKNKCYAGENEVIPSSVSFSFENDEETIIKKLSSGSFSAGFISPYSEIPENTAIEKTIENTVYGFIFNCSDEIISNKNIRRALTLSTDVSLFESDDESVSKDVGFIPSSCLAGSKNYRDSVGLSELPDMDTKKALKCWNAGLTELESEEISVKILCTKETDNFVHLQLQQWQKLFGLSCAITVEITDFDSISSAVKKGDYQIALSSVTSDYENAVTFLNEFSGGGIFRFDSSGYDAVISRLLISDGDSELISGCLTAEKIILENSVFMPVYSKGERFVVSKDIEDIYLGSSENTICFMNAKRFD